MSITNAQYMVWDLRLNAPALVGLTAEEAINAVDSLEDDDARACYDIRYDDTQD